MKQEQWDDMTEGMKEEPTVVTDYLEACYDEIADEDIICMFEYFGGKPAGKKGREQLFSELLEWLYPLTEEKPKEFWAKMKALRNLLVK